MERTNSSNEHKSKYETLIENVDPSLLEEWKQIQNNLKSKLIEIDLPHFDITTIKYFGGLDISASKHSPDKAISALVICDINMKIVYEDYAFVEIKQPYVPGFLAFREVEHLQNLILNLKQKKPELFPEVFLIDGNGILHSNRFGIASHLGVLLDICTIGCGKTVFSVDGINKRKVKEIASTKLLKGGDFEYLKGDSGSIWGAALRSHDDSTFPIIISIGNKICLDSAIKIVKLCIVYRVPEPIRIADKISRKILQYWENNHFNLFDINSYLTENHEILYKNIED